MSTLTVQDALALAVEHHRNGRLDEAETLYRRILQAAPDVPDALHLLGLVERARGRPEAAIDLIRQAIGHAPDLLAAHHNLANIYRDLGRLDEAASSYQHHREASTRQTLKARIAEHRASARQTEGPGKLILGLAIGYDRDKLEPFVRSLARSGYDGDAVLFVAETAGDTIGFLRDHGIGVEVIEVHQHIPYHMALTRYVVYYEHLMKIARDPRRAGRYGRIMLTDVRDVVFQEDPFPDAFEQDLLFVLESREFSIGQCRSNGLWVSEGFGRSALEELAAKPISCSGTTFGTLRGITEYLLQMQIMALELPRSARYRVGIDQGIHNVMLHRNLLSGHGVLENARHVVTLGRGHQDITIAEDGTFLGSDGRRIKVVHQYDYHPRYQDMVMRRLAAPAA